MTIQAGYNSIIGFTEVSQTTESAGTGPAEQLFVDTFSFKKEVAEEVIDELTGTRSMRRRIVGDVTCNGTLTKSIDVNNGIGLYRHLLTGSLTSASQGSGTFIHTFSQGDDMESNERLQFFVSQGGASTTSRNWVNGVVESYGLEIAAGSVPKETWGFQFSDHGAVLNTSPAVALTFEDPINFNKCSLNLGTTITAVSQVATRDISFNIVNNVEANREIATNTVNRFTFGNREVNGTFNVVFEDTTLYDNFINNTAVAMRIDLESIDATSGTNHYVRFSLPQVHFNGATPDVELGQIVQPIEFTAIYGSNAGYQVKTEVFNSTSAVSK